MEGARRAQEKVIAVAQLIGTRGKRPDQVDSARASSCQELDKSDNIEGRPVSMGLNLFIYRSLLPLELRARGELDFPD